MIENISLDEMVRYIDHTLLKPDATQDQHDKMIRECLNFKFRSLCVNPAWVSYVHPHLVETKTEVCSVVGFPLGTSCSRTKAFEAEQAIADGATEIDMVIHVGALKSENYKVVEQDIIAVRKACPAKVVLKVIIETCLLSNQEKITACEIAQNAGADFVKTSTGFSTGGAIVADVQLMRRTVGDSVGVKASGGIRTWENAVSMIQAGANRLGMGASIAVLEGAPQ